MFLQHHTCCHIEKPTSVSGNRARSLIMKKGARLKWEWAGHVARKTDSWCKTMLDNGDYGTKKDPKEGHKSDRN